MAKTKKETEELAGDEWYLLRSNDYIGECLNSYTSGKPMQSEGGTETCLEYLLNLATSPDRPKNAPASANICLFAKIDGALDGLEGKFIGYHLNNIFPYKIRATRTKNPSASYSKTKDQVSDEISSSEVFDIMSEFYSKNSDRLADLECPSDRYDYEKLGGVISCLEEIIDRDRFINIGELLPSSVFLAKTCHVSGTESTQHRQQTATCLEKIIQQAKTWVSDPEVKKKTKYKNAFHTLNFMDWGSVANAVVEDGPNRGKTYFQLATTYDPIFDTEDEYPKSDSDSNGQTVATSEMMHSIVTHKDVKELVGMLKTSQCTRHGEPIRCIELVTHGHGVDAGVVADIAYLIGDNYVDLLRTKYDTLSKLQDRLEKDASMLMYPSAKNLESDIYVSALNDILEEVDTWKKDPMRKMGIYFSIASATTAAGAVKDLAIRKISGNEKDASVFVAASEGSGGGISYASIFKKIFKREFDSDFEYTEDTRKTFDKTCFKRGLGDVVKSVMRKSRGGYEPYEFKQDEFGINGVYEIDLEQTFTDEEVRKYIDNVEKFWHDSMRNIAATPIPTNIPTNSGERADAEATIYLTRYNYEWDDMEVLIQYHAKSSDPKQPYPKLLKQDSYRFTEILSRFPKSIKREIEKRDKNVLKGIQKILNTRKKAGVDREKYTMVISNKTADVARASICQKWENSSCISILGGCHEWASKAYADFGTYIAYLTRGNPYEHRWLARLLIHRCGDCLSIQDRNSHYSVSPGYWHLLHDAVTVVFKQNGVNETCTSKDIKRQGVKRHCTRLDMEKPPQAVYDEDEDDDSAPISDFAAGKVYDGYSDTDEIQEITDFDVSEIIRRRTSNKPDVVFVQRVS